MAFSFIERKRTSVTCFMRKYHSKFSVFCYIQFHGSVPMCCTSGQVPFLFFNVIKSCILYAFFVHSSKQTEFTWVHNSKECTFSVQAYSAIVCTAYLATWPLFCKKCCLIQRENRFQNHYFFIRHLLFRVSVLLIELKRIFSVHAAGFYLKSLNNLEKMKVLTNVF